MIYEPNEDSFLIKKHVLACISSKESSVLDMGSGSGILAKEALKKTKHVTAADIDKEAVSHLKFHGIKAVKSDLFKNIKGKFDLIIFNPPYLPEERKEPKSSRLHTEGGKEGYEIIEKFLVQAKSHLSINGKILLIFSSLTNKAKIDNLLLKNRYAYALLEKQSFFFEELYVYLIKKS